MGKKVIYLQRQSLVFMHNNTEFKGTLGMFLSHWQGLWVTCKTSQVFLKLRVASDELSLLIRSYFWITKGLGLRLEVGWPRELWFEQSASISGR
jgi:hypothetical protein